VTGSVFVSPLKALRADCLAMIPMKFLSISTHSLQASMSCMNGAAQPGRRVPLFTCKIAVGTPATKQ
jgi:hypothetical protein